jgi:hypothetical protein
MSALQTPGPTGPDAAILSVVTQLADEGVPVRAIARSTNLPYGDILEHLQSAVSAGQILQIPKSDWPIGKGQNRETREPQYPPNSDISEVTLMHLFKVTKLQCSLLSPLLQRKEVTRTAMHEIIEKRRKPGSPPTEEKLVDVVICNLRKKLKPFGLEIKTIWSQGYYMTPDTRRSAHEQIAEHSQDAGFQAAIAAKAAFSEDEDE